MRTHQPLQKGRSRFGQQNDMGTQTPKAAGRKTSSCRRVDHSFSVLPQSAVVKDVGIERPESSWHSSLVCREVPLSEERHCVEQGTVTDASEDDTSTFALPPPPSPPAPLAYLDYPEELARMLITMYPTSEGDCSGEELADAFLLGSELPPITKQSLSELDIQNIITNLKLRHDVNFDRELSFRPNLDGARGQEKNITRRRYWKALVGELELYTRLFQGTPTLRGPADSRHAAHISHAKRRIPLLFQTIQDVLKSLVPDRDHVRVDERLDVPMLMQEIERGVCDLVRLAEWMAQLLKEHCAPMRDVLVDEMVSKTREGVVGRSSVGIVRGLRALLGILEFMKLDVANHQVRNLKTLLIEDTVNFERHHHLDRLVSGRSRVSIDLAQRWYSYATWEFGAQCAYSRDVQQVQLEVFVRAVLAQLFNRNGRHEFPDTFYLDQDRLRTLKAEVEDLIHFEVCVSVFRTLLRERDYNGVITTPIRQQLHTSLMAIMGETGGYGSQQWNIQREALSLELVRQALVVTGHTLSFDHATLSETNELLHTGFQQSFNTHDRDLEHILLQQVLSCVRRHANSTATELFNDLVPSGHTTSHKPTPFAHLTAPNTSRPNPESAKWQDIAKRITHTTILHWRVWDRIAYLQEDGSSRSSSPPTDAFSTSMPPPTHSVPPPPQSSEQDSQMVTTMRTGESLEAGHDTHITPETPF